MYVSYSTSFSTALSLSLFLLTCNASMSSSHLSWLENDKLAGIEGASSKVEIPFSKARPNHLALDAYCLVIMDSVFGLVVQDANMHIQGRKGITRKNNSGTSCNNNSDDGSNNCNDSNDSDSSYDTDDDGYDDDNDDDDNKDNTNEHNFVNRTAV